MKILLIEDDSQKADRVRTTLEGAVEQPEIVIARSYQTGLKELEVETPFDFVVLDMSLPTFDPSPSARPGRPRPLGGYDLMRKLKRKSRSPKVIVLTALENFGSRDQQYTFPELVKTCTAEFPGMFLGAIYYSQSNDSWKDALLGYLVEADN